MKFNEVKERILSDADVRKEYDSLEPEYQLIRAMITCRQELRMSQQKLSNITGINRADISRLENGTANPSLKTMKRIAEGLGRKLEIRFI